MMEAGSSYRPLAGKTILFGVTGGIAAYKAADHARGLMSMGARVIPILTKNAARFVTPLTFSAITGEKARTDLFDPDGAETIPHITLARKAELFVCMPATANFLAKTAAGMADDLLTTITLATTAKRVVFPAMNPAMYENPVTQANIRRLREQGVVVVEPEEGPTACGETGKGRLPGWETIREEILAAVTPPDLDGFTVTVSAGPTREPLDPIRFLSNRSSGLMGYAIARIARRRRARVRLVSGPSSLPCPPGVDLFPVETAADMASAMGRFAKDSDVVIMAAAVADYTPAVRAGQKLKRGTTPISIDFVPAPDILAGLVAARPPGQFIVGFCAETGDVVSKAMEKFRKKEVDLLVANDVSEAGAGFEVETNRVHIISGTDDVIGLPLLHKEEVAERIWDLIIPRMSRSAD